MSIRPFKLERYFAEHEFNVPFLLSTSDPESLTLQELLEIADEESLALWRGLSLGYTESQGHPLLRGEIARMYRRIEPDQVLVLAPEEGIFVAMHVLLEPGDHVIVTFPGYQSLYEVAASLGCEVTRWILTPSGKSWSLDLERLTQAITSRTRLLVINFPHNPTGHLPDESVLKRIVALARRHELILLSDEMYRLLEYDPDRRLPPLCDLYERGISLSGLSKSFALPGLRIGWLATRQAAWLREMQALKDYTTICSSAPSEVLAIAALRARERIIARNLGIIRENLAIVDRFMAEHQAWFDWLRPTAGSVAFPGWRESQDIDRFCQRLREEEGVLLVPASIFDYPGQHFRLGLGRRSLPQALERVASHLRTHQA
jgi:aspartate/methionine/tyrosine aminotransferase